VVKVVPVKLRCEERQLKDMTASGSAAFGRRLIEQAMTGKKTQSGALAAMGEIDTMLTSKYGLRQPLATLTDLKAIHDMSMTAQLVMSGYVIAAQMMMGVMQKENRVPAETLRISGNLIYLLYEPINDDDELQSFDRAVRAADAGLSGMSSKALVFAKWAVRGYAYGDPVAVDAALAGYCMATPTKQDDGLLTTWVRKVQTASLPRKAGKK
jgi:hypothetical protein